MPSGETKPPFETRELDRAMIDRIVSAELAMPPYDPMEDWRQSQTIKWDSLGPRAAKANREKYGRRWRLKDPQIPMPYEYLLAMAHVIEGRPELRKVIEKQRELLNSPTLAAVGGDPRILIANHGMGYGIPDFEFWDGVRVSYSGYFRETYVWCEPHGHRYRGSTSSAFAFIWDNDYPSELGGEEAFLRCAHEDSKSFHQNFV